MRTSFPTRMLRPRYAPFANYKKNANTAIIGKNSMSAQRAKSITETPPESVDQPVQAPQEEPSEPSLTVPE